MITVTAMRDSPTTWIVVRIETDNLVPEAFEVWCTWRGSATMRAPDRWIEADHSRDWATSAWHPVRYASREAAIARAEQLAAPRRMLCLSRGMP